MGARERRAHRVGAACADATAGGRAPTLRARRRPRPAAFATVAVPGVDLLLPRLGYVAINLAGAAVVAWKLRAMGLLPLTSADWVSLLPDTVFVDHSVGALPLS